MVICSNSSLLAPAFSESRFDCVAAGVPVCFFIFGSIDGHAVEITVIAATGYSVAFLLVRFAW